MHTNKPDLKGFEYQAEMTFKEIGQCLGISTNLVVEIYNKAMAKLIRRYRNV